MTTPAAIDFGRFVVSAIVPDPTLEAAQSAFVDTIGVTLAGSVEPCARIVQSVAALEGGSPCCRILGTTERTSATQAALANGTAAHAHDYDDVSFVSLAHPSAALVATALACGELLGAPGRTLLEAFVIGFEIEGRLGRVMNPAHYRRGWHCTSTIGSIGAASAAARILGLDVLASSYCLSIAASLASGLKENFGTAVKPLHAGLAARNGVLAALLAKKGCDASFLAIDGPQGLLVAMDASHRSLDDLPALGVRWEILETGITVKLYPSCAATHPTLDAVLALRRTHRLEPDMVDRVTVQVDSVTPTVLIYNRPAGALEAKFSMPFCVAAALADGHVGLDTFTPQRLADPAILRLIERVTMVVDPALGESAPPLTQAIVCVHLADGRVLTARANGAKGYPDRPASQAERETKFMSCARRALPAERAAMALRQVRAINTVTDVRQLTACLSSDDADGSGGP